MLDEELDTTVKGSSLLPFISRHKKFFIISSLVGILLFASSFIDLENNSQKFDTIEVLDYGVNLSGKYNYFYLQYDSDKIDNREYLFHLLELKTDYEQYIDGVRNHDWGDDDDILVFADSVEFELEKINQDILILKNL